MGFLGYRWRGVLLPHAPSSGVVSTDSCIAPSPSLAGTFGVERPLTGLHGAGRWLAETRRAWGAWGPGHTGDARRPWGALLAVPAVPPVAGRTRVTWNTQKARSWAGDPQTQTRKAQAPHWPGSVCGGLKTRFYRRQHGQTRSGCWQDPFMAVESLQN